VPAAVFLLVNGFILLGGELLRRRAQAASVPAEVSVGAGGPVPSGATGSATDAVDGYHDGASLEQLSVKDAVIIGGAQSLALLPGISRSGVSMVTGLLRGLSHEDAARFSFLLATPVILAAGALKLPDLFGPLGNGVRGEVLVGSVASFVAAYAAVKWLTRWFETRTLIPFAVYCLVAGGVSLVVLAVR
jgi:undecaprenyl-diphosphatase